MTPDIIIWIAFALAQIADVLTTRRLLDQGGRELNPVVAFFMGRMGRQWWIAKIAIAWAGAAALGRSTFSAIAFVRHTAACERTA